MVGFEKSLALICHIETIHSESSEKSNEFSMHNNNSENKITISNVVSITEDQSTDKQIGKIKIEQINNDIIRDDTQSNDNLSTKHYEENIDPISVIENVDNVEECNFRENFEGKNNHVKDDVLGIEEYIDGNNISLVPHGKEDKLGVAITKKNTNVLFAITNLF